MSKRLNMSKRIRKVQAKGTSNDIQLNVLNNEKGPGIDIHKYNDVQSLCKRQVIPETHHQFFNLLKLNPTLEVHDLMNDLIMLTFFSIKLCVLILKWYIDFF